MSKKLFKKIIALGAVTVLLCFAFAGCGNDKTNEKALSEIIVSARQKLDNFTLNISDNHKGDEDLGELIIKSKSKMIGQREVTESDITHFMGFFYPAGDEPEPVISDINRAEKDFTASEPATVFDATMLTAFLLRDGGSYMTTAELEFSRSAKRELPEKDINGDTIKYTDASMFLDAGTFSAKTFIDGIAENGSVNDENGKATVSGVNDMTDLAKALSLKNKTFSAWFDGVAAYAAAEGETPLNWKSISTTVTVLQMIVNDSTTLKTISSNQAFTEIFEMVRSMPAADLYAMLMRAKPDVSAPAADETGADYFDRILETEGDKIHLKNFIGSDFSFDKVYADIGALGAKSAENGIRDLAGIVKYVLNSIGEPGVAPVFSGPNNINTTIDGLTESFIAVLKNFDDVLSMELKTTLVIDKQAEQFSGGKIDFNVSYETATEKPQEYKNFILEFYDYGSTVLAEAGSLPMTVMSA